MAVSSKTLPLTASCLSSTVRPGACERVAGFSLGTPVSSTSYNWLVTTSDEKRNSKTPI